MGLGEVNLSCILLTRKHSACCASISVSFNALLNMSVEQPPIVWRRHFLSETSDAQKTKWNETDREGSLRTSLTRAKQPSNNECPLAETGGQRVPTDHSGHAGGEDHGSAEIQDEHCQHRHQPRQLQPAEHGHRPAPQPLHSGQGESRPAPLTPVPRNHLFMLLRPVFTLIVLDALQLAKSGLI